MVGGASGVVCALRGCHKPFFEGIDRVAMLAAESRGLYLKENCLLIGVSPVGVRLHDKRNVWFN